MDFWPVLPIVLVISIWMIIFVTCFITFTRMLRVPTEAEIEAAHEHAAATIEEGL
jgi:hypothetical protein